MIDYITSVIEWVVVAQKLPVHCLTFGSRPFAPRSSCPDCACLDEFASLNATIAANFTAVNATIAAASADSGAQLAVIGAGVAALNATATQQFAALDASVASLNTTASQAYSGLAAQYDGLQNQLTTLQAQVEQLLMKLNATR